MNSLVLDLETITDPILPLPEPKRCKGALDYPTALAKGGSENWEYNPALGACACCAIVGACPKCGTPPDVFLPPTYHKIVAIGYAKVSSDEDGPNIEEIDVLANLDANLAEGLGRNSEKKTLQTLSSHLSAASPRIIGWNSRGFDLPVIAARCLALGVPLEWYYRGVRNQDPRYRYSDAAHYDVKDYLGDYGAGRSAGLDAVAKSIGLPGKTGVDGSMVGAMVADGKLAEVLDYCACDVAQTFGVFLRLELVRGRLDPLTYKRAARRFLGVIASEPRLRALRSGVNAGLFLLEDV